MNQFEIEEAKLVDKIIAWTKEGRSLNDDHKNGMIMHFACAGVRSYAQPEDYDAAVIAVLELVGERLNDKV
jgi:hypothetical protein